MKRETVRKILTTTIIILLVGFTFFFMDMNFIMNGKEVRFCINTNTYQDGGSKEYTGLGYKIIKYNTIAGNTDISFGTWFLKYDTNKAKLPENKINLKGKVKSINKIDENTYSLFIDSTQKGAEVNNAYVNINTNTVIMKNKLKAQIEDIGVDCDVEVYFSYPISKAYPLNVNARKINVVEKIR
ncbi:MAG: hypothetical protein RSE00_03100 [Clostridia bacterium]